MNEEYVELGSMKLSSVELAIQRQVKSRPTLVTMSEMAPLPRSRAVVMGASAGGACPRASPSASTALCRTSTSAWRASKAAARSSDRSPLRSIDKSGLVPGQDL